jgi:hypothetical protein
MLTWDGLCFAQEERDGVRKGRKIDAQPVIIEEWSNEDTAVISFDNEGYEEAARREGRVAASGPSADDKYLEERPKERDFSDKDWSKAVEGLDYSKDRPAPPPKEVKDDREFDMDIGSGTGAGISTGLQVVLFAAVIILLAFLLFMLVGGKYSRNKNIRNEKAFTIEDIEERMHESDLERFLREALSKNDYRLAVRIYYLAIIKELSLRELIRWKKDKTNREYLNEVVGRKPEIYNDFRDTTLAFEKVWYGDITISEGDYMSISPRFRRFIESLNKLS